jgi:molybdenum cofactor guanylyltransferase
MDDLGKQTACAILAGGKSSRMGTNKALLLLDGKPLIARVAATARSVFGHVIVAADDSPAYSFLGLDCVGDVFRNCGPLGGIHAALVNTLEPALFVVSCDMPFVSRELLQYILAHHASAPAKVPVMDGRVHPLCGWYSRSILPALVKRLEENRLRVMEFVDEIGASRVPISSDLPFYNNDLFVNLNAPEDHPWGADKKIPPG